MAAAGPDIFRQAAELGLSASFMFLEDPSLTFTVGLSRESRPLGPCLHLSVSARGPSGPVDSPPPEALRRIASAFSPEMRPCPPEGAFAFVHHFRAPLPSS